MYEQVSHSLLNEVLDALKPELRRSDLRHFYTRLGANFYAIHSLFHHLYGQREDFAQQMLKLVEVMATRYIERHKDLKRLDVMREKDHNWFLSQNWTAMALYADAFAGDLKGVRKRLPYLQELGVNMMHVMPILRCPHGASDGGYAVSDFRKVDDRIAELDVTIENRGCVAGQAKETGFHAVEIGQPIDRINLQDRFPFRDPQDILDDDVFANLAVGSLAPDRAVDGAVECAEAELDRLAPAD